MTIATVAQDAAPGARGFRLLLAAEVRAELARQQITGRRLARLLGESPAWAARRLAGGTAMDADDVERIARAIDVPISQLLLEAARRADEIAASTHTGADTDRYPISSSGLAQVIPLFSDTSDGDDRVAVRYAGPSQAEEHSDNRAVAPSSGKVKNANSA